MIKSFLRKNSLYIIIFLLLIWANLVIGRFKFDSGYEKGRNEGYKSGYTDASEEALVDRAALEKRLNEFINASYSKMSEESSLYSDDAKAMARVLYGLSGYQLSDNSKIAVMEVIMSRVRCSWGEFGDTIQEVCNKPLQWQGYVEDGEYLKSDYDLAFEFLSNGGNGRLTPEGCLFLTVSYQSVEVRKEWDGKSSWEVR